MFFLNIWKRNRNRRKSRRPPSQSSEPRSTWTQGRKRDKNLYSRNYCSNHGGRHYRYTFSPPIRPSTASTSPTLRHPQTPSPLRGRYSAQTLWAFAAPGQQRGSVVRHQYCSNRAFVRLFSSTIRIDLLAAASGSVSACTRSVSAWLFRLEILPLPINQDLRNI